MEKESLKMRFNGADEIDLETLSYSLNSTLECLKIIADNTIQKDDYCKFIVKSVEKGSFIIDISVIKEIADSLIQMTAGIVTILTGIFAIRKHLKGKVPKEINRIADNNSVIKNVDGDNQTVNTQVLNIYINDMNIEEKLARLSSALAKDDARTTLIIEDQDNSGLVKNSVEYAKSDLEQTSIAIDFSSFDTIIEESIIEALLKIKKLYFQGEAKWDFILLSGNNQTISATIEDTKFLDSIQKGTIYVTADTRLLVTLKCKYKLDKDSHYFGKGVYAILEVKDINNPPVQISMDDIH